MENKEFIPRLKHKSYGLEIEINDDLSKFRFKGTAEKVPSKWKDIKYDSNNIMYFLINREKYYYWDFNKI